MVRRDTHPKADDLEASTDKGELTPAPVREPTSQSDIQRALARAWGIWDASASRPFRPELPSAPAPRHAAGSSRNLVRWLVSNVRRWNLNHRS
jgi:hypothetical protein